MGMAAVRWACFVAGVRGVLAGAGQSLGVAGPVAAVTEQGQGLLVAGGGRWVVPGLLLHEARVVGGVGLAGQVAQVAERRQACWWLAAAAGWSPVCYCTTRGQAWLSASATSALLRLGAGAPGLVSRRFAVVGVAVQSRGGSAMF
jgi:hypothetical protein